MTSRQIAFSTILVAAGIFAAGAWLLPARDRPRDQGGPPTPPSATPPPFTCSESSGSANPLVAPAIARGEAFLQARGDGLDPMMALILDFVGRRFAVPWMQAAANPLRTPVAATPCADGGSCGPPSSLDSFRRLIDPRATIAADRLPTGTGIDALTALALHCRSNGLPTDYPLRIAQGLDPAAAGSDPPLAAMALQWAVEQGCLDRGSDAIRALRTQALTQLLAVGEGVPRDQPVLALAMLDYLGEGRCIRSEWIDALVRAQRDDGGWSDGADQPSNDHTTTLALWVLLTQARPAQSVAWIPQIGDQR